MRKYVSSAPLVKTLLSDFRQLYFEKVNVSPSVFLLLYVDVYVPRYGWNKTERKS